MGFCSCHCLCNSSSRCLPRTSGSKFWAMFSRDSTCSWVHTIRTFASFTLAAAISLSPSMPCQPSWLLMQVKSVWIVAMPGSKARKPNRCHSLRICASAVTTGIEYLHSHVGPNEARPNSSMSGSSVGLRRKLLVQTAVQFVGHFSTRKLIVFFSWYLQRGALDDQTLIRTSSGGKLPSQTSAA